jgi:hypothetical protein
LEKPTPKGENIYPLRNDTIKLSIFHLPDRGRPLMKNGLFK